MTDDGHGELLEIKKMFVNRQSIDMIGDFIQWLLEKGVWFMKRDASGKFDPYAFVIVDLIAEFLDIDLVQAEKERLILLERLKRD